MSMLDVLCCALGSCHSVDAAQLHRTAYNKAQALSISEKELKQSNREVKDSQASLQLTRSDPSTSMELIDSLKAQVNKLTGDAGTMLDPWQAHRKEQSRSQAQETGSGTSPTTKSLLKQAEIDRESSEALLAEARTGRQEAMNAAKVGPHRIEQTE